MENDLKHPKDDTSRITLLYNLAEEYYGYDTAKAMQYLEQGHTKAEKMHYLFQVANYYEMKAKLFINVSKLDVMPLLDTAISYYEKNMARKLSLSDVQQSKLSIATCKSQKGIILSKEGKYKEAIPLFLEAVEAWKLSDDPEKNEAIANYYGSISTIYYDLKQPEKALEYDEAAIPYRLLDKNEEMLAMTYFYVSDDLVSLSQVDSALFYVQQAKPLAEKLNKHKLNYYFFSRSAAIYRNKKDYDQSVFYYKKALAEAEKGNDLFNICAINRAIAECYQKFDDYNSARKYLLTALPVTVANNYLKEELETLRNLVNVEDKTNHPAQAYIYLKQADAINDSLKTIESKAAVAEIENKYQAAEKEKEIIQLQKDKQIQALSIKQKSTLNYILVGSLAGLLVLGFLIYRNYRQKQQLQQQKISELEKDRQLMAVDAMLKGQEEERGRLAKDLHDGLGGMLSGVKYSLNNMKDNLIITPDNMAVFERSLDMIDASIKELRRVAHNMMPEMLTKFGLDEALKEYCNSVTATKLLTVKYQSFGMNDRVDSSAEIIIYRIVQELLNNVLKHAAATEVLVQMIREDNRLNVLVEDNGKGFNTAILENNRGAGWTNIRSRVEYLKGHLDIHSEINKGTSVSVEFNV
ncbi:MAG: sensor histidine kinase [Bacteroidota bacterium]|nr:sensor histidine kinase [Bacteroidota bacterium]